MREGGPGSTVVGGGGLRLRQPVLLWEGGDCVWSPVELAG